MTYEAKLRFKKALKYIIMIVVSASVGIFLGHLVSNYELRFMADRQYYQKYKNVDIYTAGEVNAVNLSNYMYMLEYVPDDILECCEKLYFTGSDLDIPMNDSGISSAYGLTQGRTIYISTEVFGMEVVAHEFFHAYDNTHGEPSAHSEEFRSAYKNEWNRIYVVAGYDEMLPAEYFAQAGAYYILAPEHLEEAAPDTYSFFNDMFGYY